MSEARKVNLFVPIFPIFVAVVLFACGGDGSDSSSEDITVPAEQDEPSPIAPIEEETPLPVEEEESLPIEEENPTPIEEEHPTPAITGQYKQLSGWPIREIIYEDFGSKSINASRLINYHSGLAQEYTALVSDTRISTSYFDATLQCDQIHETYAINFDTDTVVSIAKLYSDALYVSEYSFDGANFIIDQSEDGQLVYEKLDEAVEISPCAEQFTEILGLEDLPQITGTYKKTIPVDTLAGSGIIEYFMGLGEDSVVLTVISEGFNGASCYSREIREFGSSSIRPITLFEDNLVDEYWEIYTHPNGILINSIDGSYGFSNDNEYLLYYYSNYLSMQKTKEDADAIIEANSISVCEDLER